MLNNAGANSAGAGFAAAFPYLSLHTTATLGSSVAESTAARVAAGWSVSAAGVVSATNKAFTGGAASGACLRVGYWSLASGGVFGGSSLTTGDTTFNAAGQYTVDSVTETPTET